jgi:hypothetical protein
LNHPDVYSVKADGTGSGAYRVGADQTAVTSPELGDSMVTFIDHPDIYPVEADARGTIPDSDGSGNSACSGIDLAYRVVTIISHPDVGTVEADASGITAYGVGADSGYRIGSFLILY